MRETEEDGLSAVESCYCIFQVFSFLRENFIKLMNENPASWKYFFLIYFLSLV